MNELTRSIHATFFSSSSILFCVSGLTSGRKKKNPAMTLTSRPTICKHNHDAAAAVVVAVITVVVVVVVHPSVDHVLDIPGVQSQQRARLRMKERKSFSSSWKKSCFLFFIIPVTNFLSFFLLVEIWWTSIDQFQRHRFNHPFNQHKTKIFCLALKAFFNWKML